MDDLEMLSLVRTEPAPSPETVARDRYRLRAVIGTAATAGTAAAHEGGDAADAHHHVKGRAAHGTAIGDDRHDRVAAHDLHVDVETPSRSAVDELLPRRAGRTSILLTAAAAVVALATVAGLLVSRSGDDGTETTVAGAPDRADVPAPSGAADAADASASAPRCGELPLEVPVPEGYTGPVDGPSPDAAQPPAEGQLVMHWTSDSGSMEVRWPAGSDEATVDDWQTSPALGREVFGHSPQQAPSGRWAAMMTIRAPLLGEEPCSMIQFTVFGADHADAEAKLNELQTALFEPGNLLGGPVLPLVVDTEAADAIPPAVLCHAPPGVEAPPNRRAELHPVEGHASPRDALAAFLATEPLIQQTGYVELALPDGSLAYGRPMEDPATLELDRDRGYLVVVHVVESSIGWAATDWESTGC